MSQPIHSNEDRETIAAWRSDLDKILHIFHIRYIVFIWLLLTLHSQIELATDTQTTVSDLHRGAANTHAIVSEVHRDVANTYDMLTDIHRNILKSQGEASGQHLSVSDTRTLSIIG